jgi:hypothetical protein
LASDGWVTETCCSNVKWHSQYPATDVAADSLWVNQVCCADRYAYANVLGKVYIRHYSHMLHIGRTPKAPDRLVNLTPERVDQPGMQRREW